MSLEIEYGRPFQRIEPESLQNIIIKCVRYTIKPLYPEKIILSMIEEYVKKVVPFSRECEYQFDFRNKDKEKAWVVATIYHPSLNKSHGKKIKN